MKEADIFPIEIDLDFSNYQQKAYKDDDELDENEQGDSNVNQKQDTDDLDLFYDEK
jgi:hypothetical protein